MQQYERDILNNLMSEFYEIELEEFGERVISFFNGKPEISCEDKWAVIFIYSMNAAGTDFDKHICLGFGEQGGNGKRSNWGGQLYWELRDTNPDTPDYLIQGEIANGSPWSILNGIFSKIEEYLEQKKGN